MVRLRGQSLAAQSHCWSSPPMPQPFDWLSDFLAHHLGGQRSAPRQKRVYVLPTPSAIIAALAQGLPGNATIYREDVRPSHVSVRVQAANDEGPLWSATLTIGDSETEHMFIRLDRPHIYPDRCPVGTGRRLLLNAATIAQTCGIEVFQAYALNNMGRELTTCGFLPRRDVWPQIEASLVEGVRVAFRDAPQQVMVNALSAFRAHGRAGVRHLVPGPGEEDGMAANNPLSFSQGCREFFFIRSWEAEIDYTDEDSLARWSWRMAQRGPAAG